MKRKALTLSILASLIMSSHGYAQDTNWIAVTGADTLREFVSGIKAERELPNGEMSRGEYLADGTGILHSWGASIPRTWEIKGDDQFCITAARDTKCYVLEQNRADKNLYRARDTAGNLAEFRVTDKRAVVKAPAKEIGNEGGAAAPSASELAAQLSNPNSPLATLNFKNQFRWFEGDLPDADGQSSYTLLFQPALPFPLASGDLIFWRPAIPLVIDQPVFDAQTGSFSGESGLGDFAMDLAYSPKLEGGLQFAAGIITAWPTATNDLGTDRFTLGPELFLGMATQEYVYGIFPSHQWDIGGSGDADINMTTIQAFYTYLPGGGWSIGTGPIMTYNWNSEQWTVPLQANVGKTVVLGGRPWKFNVELNYYVEKADGFGPDWMIGINISPVVKNGLASLFGLGE